MRHSLGKVVLLAVVLGFLTSGLAWAGNGLKMGAKSLSFGIVGDELNVSGRYMTADDLAILAGFGLRFGSGDIDGTDFGFSAGARKYLTSDDLATFVGGTIFYDSDESTGPKVKTFGIDAHFGAEYFFSLQVSAEAQIGVVLKDESNGGDSTSFGTFSSGVRVNVYLP